MLDLLDPSLVIAVNFISAVFDNPAHKLSDKVSELLRKLNVKDRNNIPAGRDARNAWLTEELARRMPEDDSLRDMIRNLVGNPLGYDKDLPPSFEEYEWSGIRLPVYSWYSRYLLAAGNPALPAVDDAILLLPPLDEEDALRTSFPERHTESTIPPYVLRPDAKWLEELITLCGANSLARKYLQDRKKLYKKDLKDNPGEQYDESYTHRTKVGLKHVEGATAFQHLTLHIAPTSQWVEINFNRLILQVLSTDDQLRQAYSSRLQESLAGGVNKSGLLSPGTLYVESATLTSDGRLIVVQKAPAGSHFARIGRPWTTPVERAVLWSDITDGAIAAESAMRVAIRDEFNKKSSDINLIAEEDVESVRWIGVALECHLNAALLAIVRLKLPWSEFKNKYRSDDFQGKPKGIPYRDIPTRVFAPNQDGQWHTTARMRALYVLIEQYGIRRTASKLAEVRALSP
jgi:hypothetical protein